MRMVDRGIRIVIVERTIVMVMVITRILMVHYVSQLHTGITEIDHGARHRISGEEQHQRDNDDLH